MSKYDDILSYIASTASDVKNGMTVLGVWDDNEHLNDWLEMKKTNVRGCRTLTLQSSLLPILINGNKDEVVIIGIAISKEADYSDLNLIYHEYEAI